MKRRQFGVLAGSGLAAASVVPHWARAANKDPGQLSTTLTPFGAERAGNADGSIPAWTGGLQAPAGWDAGSKYYPDPFADEKPLLTINAGNMAQHADRLADGVQALMTKYGFSINVYPTHRTASAPQDVYDNTAKNVSTAAVDPAGGRLGFSGAIGGMPFPIPDLDQPQVAGAQMIWNNNCRWSGRAINNRYQSYAVSSGHFELAYSDVNWFWYEYYKKGTTLDNFSGVLFKLQAGPYLGPANLVGEQLVEWQYTNPKANPARVWQLLNGQGRVRKAPEVQFDTPSNFSNGIAGYDEYFGFNGSPEKYDWTYVTKKEMYVPYNNNGIMNASPRAAHLTHFLDPAIVRWELHRVWVVDAQLHPGERNVLQRRRLYLDEDTWITSVVDAWDANNNLYKTNLVYNMNVFDLPGTIYQNNTVHNLQTGNYCSIDGPWDQKAHPGGLIFKDDIDQSIFDPMNMAASAQY